MDLLRQLVRMFAEEYPRMLNDITVAAESQDAAGLWKMVHKLKGSLLQFAAPAAAAAAAALENCAALNRLNQAPSLVAKLTVETDCLLELLQSMISGTLPARHDEKGESR